MEHTIQEIRAEFNRLDAMMGVDTSHVEIIISDRMINHYGICKFRREGRKVVPTQIVIARFLLGEETAFWDTVRHEYAHAAVSLRTGVRHGHDAQWKDICRRIGAEPVSRAASCDGFERRRAQSVRYIVRCETCGAVYERVRRSAFVAAVAEGKTTYVCRCGGRHFTLLQGK